MSGIRGTDPSGGDRVVGMGAVRFQVSGFKFQVSGCRLQASSFRMRGRRRLRGWRAKRNGRDAYYRQSGDRESHNFSPRQLLGVWHHKERKAYNGSGGILV